MKKILFCIMVGGLILGSTGCTEEQQEITKKEEEIRGNCVVTECIKQLKVTNTVEEINEIIGFEGEKSEYSDTYKWKLSASTSITREKTGENPILQATIDKETIKSDKVDFSTYSEIKELLDNGKSLTHQEIVTKLGGVEGTLAGLTSTSKRYIWVDKHDRTFSATFSDTLNGKCSIISLR